MHEKEPDAPLPGTNPPSPKHEPDRAQADARVRIVQPAEDIPVFNCVVYVRSVGQEFAARVANLGNDQTPLEATSASQRSALQQVVREFKELMQSSQDAGEQVRLLDPPPPPDKTETALYVPVHL